MWVTSIFAGLIAGYSLRIFKLLNPALAIANQILLQYSLWVGIVFIFLALIPAPRHVFPESAKKHHYQPAETSSNSEAPWGIIARFTFAVTPSSASVPE